MPNIILPTALDSFRNPTPEEFAAINPLLATGAATVYGQSDVEGNIAYFNNIEANTIKADANLIMPFGNQTVTGSPTIATDGAFHYLTGIQGSGMPLDANGALLVPLPGAYLYDVTLRIVVTSPSANWIVQIGVMINGAGPVNISSFAWPASLLTANMNYTINFYTFYPTDFVAAGGTAAINFQVSVSGAASATVNYFDGQLNYLGNQPGNSRVRPSLATRRTDGTVDWSTVVFDAAN